jgi:nicotinamidase-related amidase
MNCALILIDIQNDYFPGGKHALHQPEQAAYRANQVLEYFRGSEIPVYHVRHVSIKPGASFFLPDSFGAEIHRSVTPQPSERIFTKHLPNAFYKTGLSEELLRRDITELVLCGMMSHMCVDSSVRAAYDFGFSVTLLEDACAEKALTWNGKTIPAETVHQTIMASLDGLFARVIRTDQFFEDIINARYDFITRRT